MYKCKTLKRYFSILFNKKSRTFKDQKLISRTFKALKSDSRNSRVFKGFQGFSRRVRTLGLSLSLRCFSVYKLLFSGFVQFKGYFVHGQNNSEKRQVTGGIFHGVPLESVT